MYNELVMDCSRVPVGSALVALADPTRQGMVELLAERPRRVGELVAAFPMSQPAVSRHLRVLRQHGLVEERPLDGDRRGGSTGCERGRWTRWPGGWTRSEVLGRAPGAVPGLRRSRGGALDGRHRQGQSVGRGPGRPGPGVRLYREINRWWKRDSWYWNDRERARGLRIEPFVGGRFVEVYDEDTGEGFEIGRVRVWEPGRRVVYSWRQADWPAGEEMEIEVRFEPTPAGTLVTIEVRGWEGLTGGTEIGRGYGEGAKELLTWYAEAAASPG